MGSSLQDTWRWPCISATVRPAGPSFETDDPNPPPMRVDVLSQYSDGVWRPTSGQLFDTGVSCPRPTPARPSRAGPPTTRVTDNRMAARYPCLAPH